MRIRLHAPLIAVFFMSSAVAATPTPSLETLWELVQNQQKQIEELQRQLAAAQAGVDSAQQAIASTESNQSRLDQKIESTAELVEAGRAGKTSWADKTSIGGYGELHYNSWNDESTDADGVANDRDRIDFHRFVIYLAHEFTDSIRFFSELEVEHAVSGDGEPGEVELEQAWIEMDLNQSHRFRAGLDIVPIGLVNVTHEPNTFYGVERNQVETEIIPSTWWEAGAGLLGEIAPGWNYDLVVHSGLVVPTTGSNAFRPRSGRTKIAEAENVAVAVTGRIRYTGLPGLEVALSGQYQSDYTGTADAFDVDAFLVEGHIDWRHRSGFGLRAMYASWFYDDDPAAGLNAGLVGADNLDGYYVEPAYRFASPIPLPGEFGIFARYSEYDAPNQLPNPHFERYEQITVGMNYWPTPQVVFKVDGQWQDADGPVAQTFDGFNLGMGYQF